MTLGYNDLIALLTKAIQEQQGIFENQESRMRSRDEKIKVRHSNMEILVSGLKNSSIF
jgi:hypothetical protein